MVMEVIIPEVISRIIAQIFVFESTYKLYCV